MPRKKIQVDADQVRELARLGCTRDEIAGVLSIARTTFVMRMKEKKFREAYDRGIAEGNASLRRAQYDGAVGGNTGLLVWLGKNRLRQVDRLETHNETTLNDSGNAIDKLISAVDRLAERGRSPTDISATDT